MNFRKRISRLEDCVVGECRTEHGFFLKKKVKALEDAMAALIKDYGAAMGKTQWQIAHVALGNRRAHTSYRFAVLSLVVSFVALIVCWLTR